MATRSVFVGIDLYGDRMYAFATPDGPLVSRPYCEEGVVSLIQYLTSVRPKLVLLKGMGSYEREILSALLEAKLPVFVVKSDRVRSRTGNGNKQAKVDRVDAQALADYARAVYSELRFLDKALDRQKPQKREARADQGAEHALAGVLYPSG